MLVGGLRLAGLVMRMVLALFMAKYLSFADIGIFSLLVGLTGMLPGAAGLGLSYFVNREIVGAPSPRSTLVARDRLIVTALCGALASTSFLVVASVGGLELPFNPTLGALIILLEMIGFDLHLLLIARYRAATANFLLFIRSASWIPVFMTIAYAYPAYRDLGSVVIIWLLGLLVGFFVSVTILRTAVFNSVVLTSGFDFKWFGITFRRARPIWISDFALAVGQNSDRFIISSILGVAPAGVYYFYFSIANAAFLVVQSATTQPYMPRLRTLFAQRVLTAFVGEVDKYFAYLVVFSLLVFFMAEIGTIVLVNEMGRPELIQQWHVMPIMLAAMFGKAVNDYLGIIDYITEHDRRFISLNIWSFVLVVVSVSVLSSVYGLTGAAVGVAVTMLIFASGRYWLWQRRLKPRLRGLTIVGS